MARPQRSSVTPRRAAHAKPAKANVHERYYFAGMGPNHDWWFAGASIVALARRGGASVWRGPPPASAQPEGRPCAAELTTQNRRSNEMLSNFRDQNARLRGRAGLPLPSRPRAADYKRRNRQLRVRIFVHGSNGDVECDERSGRDEECLLGSVDRRANQACSSSVHDGLDVQHQSLDLVDGQLVVVRAVLGITSVTFRELLGLYCCAVLPSRDCLRCGLWSCYSACRHWPSCQIEAGGEACQSFS